MPSPKKKIASYLTTRWQHFWSRRKRPFRLRRKNQRKHHGNYTRVMRLDSLSDVHTDSDGKSESTLRTDSQESGSQNYTSIKAFLEHAEQVREMDHPDDGSLGLPDQSFVSMLTVDPSLMDGPGSGMEIPLPYNQEAYDRPKKNAMSSKAFSNRVCNHLQSKKSPLDEQSVCSVYRHLEEELSMVASIQYCEF